MNNEQLIVQNFPVLQSHQVDQFRKMGPLYLAWNVKINVISRKDIEHLYTRHILHSLAIGKIVELKPGTHVMDVGTGGGFPGLPLAILFPHTEFLLVDSIGKKLKVVQDIARELDLKNVLTVHERAEKIKGNFDFVVSRAVTDMKTLYDWVHLKIRNGSSHALENGILLLKGGDLGAELSALNRPYKLYQIADFFKDPFFETKKIVHIPKGKI